MADFRSGEIWGLDDGSAIGKALTAAYVASDGDPIIITKPTDLVCVADVQAVAADSVDFRLDVCFSGNTFQPLPEILPVAGDRGVIPSVLGTVGAHTIIFHLPWTGPGAYVRPMARRTGGTAGTLLRMTAHALPADRGSILDGLGALAGGGQLPVSGAEFELLAATALPASPAAFAYSAAFDSGNSDLLIVAINKTTVNVPTAVEFDLQVQADGQWRTDTAIQGVAGGYDDRAGTYIRRQDIGAGNPEYHLERIELEPLTTYRLGARYAGGAQPTMELIGRLVKR